MALRQSLGLFLDSLQRRVQASPRWRTGAPDVDRGADRRRIVERAQTHDRQIASPHVIRKEVASAGRAEPSADVIAAVCDADVFAQASLNFECLGVENGAGRAIAS